MAISIKTKEEIGILREGGRYLAKILQELVLATKPGISTFDLDVLAEKLMRDIGGRPSFKGYAGRGDLEPYPGSICVSVNDEVVHTIPRKEKILKDGDAVAIDIGMWWPFHNNGSDNKFIKPLCTDMAVTIGIGKISNEAENLIRATKKALEIGINAARPGNRVGDIGHAIFSYLNKEKIGVVRDLAGHGVGYEVHEDPLIPNFGKSGTGAELKEGMVLALEPITALGSPQITLQKDGWAYKTQDKSLSAHFEHTIVVQNGGAQILTL